MVLVRSMLVLSLLVFVVACSKPSTMEISQKKGTVATVFPEVEKFVKQKYPEAIFVGFNNHGPSFERVNRAPTVPDQSGETSYWFYLFAKNPQALTDRKIADVEAIGVRFNEGKLELYESVKTMDREYDSGAAIGRDLLKTDSSEIFARALRKIQSEVGTPSSILHVDFNCSPGYCEITFFEDDTKGYDIKFSPTTGEAFYPRSVTFGS